MSYDPPASSSHWQQDHVNAAPSHGPRAVVIEVDKIRLARLLILLALVGFWIAVFMAIF